MSGYMLDTNIFNLVVEDKVDISLFPHGNRHYVTHIQSDEIIATPDQNKRAGLLKVFKRISSSRVTTESAVWGISRWGQSKWSTGKELDTIKTMLDRLKKKKNNIQDALIAETAIKNNLILISNDNNLKTVVTKIGGTSISFEEYLKT